MSGRFGYARLPYVYEGTDTAALKAEREMFAEIAETRSPQEYIEVLRRYNRLSDLAENSVTRQMRREKAALDAQEYYQREAALGASRKEVEGQPPASFDPIDYFPQYREKWRRESEARAKEAVSQAKPEVLAPASEGEWWPYDPDKPIGDGDREYQQRFKPEKGD